MDTSDSYNLYIRNCDRVQSRAKADAIAKHFLAKDTKSFWKAVKKLSNDTATLSSTINGISGQQPIAKLWQVHFHKLLNDAKECNEKVYVINRLLNANNDTFNSSSTLEMYNAINDLKLGKSPGLDGIQSEHYKYASPKIACVVKMLFNSCFTHNYLPK